MSLKPQLRHNREEFNRLVRTKWKALAGAALAIFPVTLLLAVVPAKVVGAAGIVLLAAIAFIVLYFEFKMTQVFRRDLHERDAGRDGLDNPGAAENRKQAKHNEP